jgi:glycerophosphoryl diester phosphodiesterase
MKKRYIAFAAVAAAAGTYLGAICPRLKGKPDMSSFEGKVFAHRGMFGAENPENSLGAFKKAVENGYGIELDVQLSSDGEAVVFHDPSLLRLYGENILVNSLTAEELKEYGIPTLREALEIIDGKVPVIVELKGESRDISVAPIAAEVLDEYVGEYCVESFNPFIIKWFKDCRPDVIRGQLSGSHLTEGKKSIKFFMLENLMFNFISRPDFIAYDHKSRAKVSLALCRKLFNIPVFAWTIKTSEEWSACADKFDAYICDGLPKKRTAKK